MVTGYGETAGAALTAHPGVGHLSFTGSVEVGRIISHAAAERLIPVTMELGGKSPNILFADADLDRAVPVIVNAILQNAGQTCSAGSRLLVEESVHEAVTGRIAKIFAGVRIGPALDDPDLGPLISGPQRDRVISYLSALGHGRQRPDQSTAASRSRRPVRKRLLLPADPDRRRGQRQHHVPRGGLRPGARGDPVPQSRRGGGPWPTAPTTGWSPGCGRRTSPPPSG